MSQDTRKAIIPRMRSAKGHLEGVLRMLEDSSVNTREVLKQLSAVQSALRKINTLVLSGHVHEQVTAAARYGKAESVADNVMEAMRYRS